MFVQYNRAKSFHSGTGEKKDMVTVTQMTDLRAGLKPGDMYELLDYRSSGEKLVVEACAAIAGNTSIPDTMMISIGMGHSICSDSSTDLKIPVVDSALKEAASPPCQPSELSSAAPAELGSLPSNIEDSPYPPRSFFWWILKILQWRL
jgi:hypothetical protein